LLVVPVLILEGTNVAEPWPTIALVGDWTIWLVFLAEVVALLAVTPNRRRWITRHPLDVAIVVLTPPFMSGLVQSSGSCVCCGSCACCDSRSSRAGSSRWRACATRRYSRF
jgi:hypothetical protein